MLPDEVKDNRKMQKALGLPVGIQAPDMDEVRRIHGGLPTPDRPPAAGNDSPNPAGGSKVVRSRKDRTNEESRKHRPGSGRGRDGGRHAESGRKGSTHGDRRPEEARRESRASKSTRKSGTGATGDELTGTVVHYSRRKGFGFIKVKGRKDLFVHNSAVGSDNDAAKVLAKGNQVAFVITKGQKGPVASNVRALTPIGN